MGDMCSRLLHDVDRGKERAKHQSSHRERDTPTTRGWNDEGKRKTSMPTQESRARTLRSVHSSCMGLMDYFEGIRVEQKERALVSGELRKKG